LYRSLVNEIILFTNRVNCDLIDILFLLEQPTKKGVSLNHAPTARRGPPCFDLSHRAPRTLLFSIFVWFVCFVYNFETFCKRLQFLNIFIKNQTNQTNQTKPDNICIDSFLRRITLLLRYKLLRRLRRWASLLLFVTI